jgi:hypothetical protein
MQESLEINVNRTCFRTNRLEKEEVSTKIGGDLQNLQTT